MCMEAANCDQKGQQTRMWRSPLGDFGLAREPGGWGAGMKSSRRARGATSNGLMGWPGLLRGGLDRKPPLTPAPVPKEAGCDADLPVPAFGKDQ